MPSARDPAHHHGFCLAECGPPVRRRPRAPTLGLLNANPYAQGIANLGAQTVAAHMIDHGWNVAFGFADTTSAAAPFLDGTAPTRCQLLAVSVPFEDTYHHVPRMLRHCGVPAYSTDRGQDAPIVVAGGMAMINPMPLAPFFDAMVIGDGREPLRAIGDLVLHARRRGHPRRDLLAGLAQLDHVYVPSLYHFRYDPHGSVLDVTRDDPAPPEVSAARPLDLTTHPIHSLWTSPRACYPHDDYYSVMMAMGCPYTCPFCVVGNVQGTRDGRALTANPDDVLALARHRRDRYGTNLVKLFFASSLARRAGVDPLNLKNLLRALLAERFAVRVGSLNIRQADPELLELLRRGGQDRVTVAPETAEALRPSIGKPYSGDDQLIDVAANAGRLGLGLDLYTMLGVPGEQPVHIRALADLIAQVRTALGRAQTLAVSINPVFCKSQTPYERHATLRPETARGRLAALRGRLNNVHGIRWVSVIDDPMAYYQPILAQGGPELAPVLDHLSASYRPTERAWRAAVDHLVTGGDDRYFRPRPDGERLPWQHIVVNDHDKLARRLRKHRLKATVRGSPRGHGPHDP